VRALKKKIVLSILLTAIVLLALPHAVAAPSAVIQNDSTFIDEAGYYHIVGEVKNTGDVWLQFVRVSATLKDQAGVIVDTSFTYTLLDRLPSNIASGFDIVELDTGKSAQIRGYTLALEYREVTPLTTALEILNTSSSKNSLGWLEIVGEVRNNGDTISEYTKVTATFYGADGKVVDVAFTYTDPHTIPAHGQQSFKLILSSTTRSSLANTWSLDTQSNQYANIPEYPMPIMIAGVALSLAIVTLRRKESLR